MAETQGDIAQYQSDHDLLIELRTEMRGMRTDIKGLQQATTDKTTDHELRLRVLEKTSGDMQSSSRTWRFVITTGFSTIGVAIAIIGLTLSQS